MPAATTTPGLPKPRKKRGKHARLKPARRSQCMSHLEAAAQVKREIELTIGMECKVGSLFQNPPTDDAEDMTCRVHLTQFQNQVLSSPALSTWRAPVAATADDDNNEDDNNVGSKDEIENEAVDEVKDPDSIIQWETTVKVLVTHDVLVKLDKHPHLFFCVGMNPASADQSSSSELESAEAQDEESDAESEVSETDDPDGDGLEEGQTKGVQYDDEQQQSQTDENAGAAKGVQLTPDEEAQLQSCANAMSSAVVQMHAADLSGLLDKCGVVEMNTLGGTACGVSDVRVYIKASAALLDVENSVQRFAYNPLTVSVVSVRPLPGVQLERNNPAMHEYITNQNGEYDNFMLMRQHCLPVYACAQIPRGLHQPPRIVFTQPTPQGSTKVKWEHRTTILAGLINSDELAEQLENVPVITWLHDRDVSHRRDGMNKEMDIWRQEYFRDKLTSLIEEQQANPPEVSKKKKSKKKSDTEGAPQEDQRGITSDMLMSYVCRTDPTGLDTFLCHKLWALTLEQRVEQMHGEAKVRLEDLWCSSQEIINNYRTRLAQQQRDLLEERNAVELLATNKKKRKEVAPKQSAPPSPEVVEGGEVEGQGGAEGELASPGSKSGADSGEAGVTTPGSGEGDKDAVAVSASGTTDTTDEGALEQGQVGTEAAASPKESEGGADVAPGSEAGNESPGSVAVSPGQISNASNGTDADGSPQEGQEGEEEGVGWTGEEQKPETGPPAVSLEEYIKRPIVMDQRATVGPVKRVIAIGGDIEQHDLDISNAERIVRQPGMYFDQGTEIRVRAMLAYPVFAHPLSVAPRPGFRIEQGVPQYDDNEDMQSDGGPVSLPKRRAPFERWIVMMAYNNTGFLRRVLNALTEVNQKAFPNESLRSYQMSDAERSAVNRSEIDIIAGFHIVDDDFRIIVLEGLGAGGMSYLHKAIPRESWNTDDTMILADAQIRFTKRLYTSFDADLKMVRLRDPLSVLVHLPEIYNRNKVEPACFEALMRLTAMRSVDRLTQVAKNDIFPLVNMITKLESKYGESVSLEDITGFKDQRRTNSRGLRKTQNTSSDAAIGNTSSNQFDADDEVVQTKPPVPRRRKGPTEQRNVEFDRHRKQWKPRDFLREHMDMRQLVSQQVKQRLAAREELAERERQAFGDQLFLYSGQKNNYKEIKLDQMRARLQKIPGATFTFSEEFQSLTFSLINEGLIKANERQETKNKFITKKGWVYPAPRDSMEARRDPNTQLSQTRIDDLRVPWDEAGSLGGTAHASNNHPAPRNSSGIEFDCIPSKSNEEGFGGYKSDGTKNPDFYTSVHLCGEGLAAETEAVKLREQEEWMAKVVVKNLRMRPHVGNSGEKPIEVDKYKEILHGKPMKAALRSLRTLTMRNGKQVKLRAMPVSIMQPRGGQDGEDLDPAVLGRRRRHAAHAAMACNKGKGDNNGRPDLVRYVNPAKERPKAQQIIYRRSIRPLEASERMPPLFGRHSASHS